MTIPPLKLDILAGENTAIPELKKTGTEIARVAAGASGGLDPMQKLSKAFVMSEAREGTMAMRAIRAEIVNVGSSALGVTGPLGHVGVLLAEMGVGGTTGLAAIAGFAAIAFEVKSLLNLTKNLEENLGKLNVQFASMGGAGAGIRSRIGGMQQQSEALQEQLDDPSFWDRLKFKLFSFDPSGAGGVTARQGVLSQQATLANEQTREAIELEKEHQQERERGFQKERAWERTLAESQAVVDKLRLGLHPTNLALEAMEHRSKLLTIGLSGLKPEEQQRLFLLENERDRLERVNAVMKDLHERAEQLRHDQAASPTQPSEGDIYNRARLGLGGNVSPLNDLTGAGTTPMENTVKGAIEKAGGKWDPGPSGKAPADGKLDTKRLAAESVALLAALRSGSTGGGITAFGEMATTLGGVKSLGLAGLATAGPIIGAFGSAISLLDNSQDRRHKEMMAELRKISQRPQIEATRVQPIFVGASSGQVAYEAQRRVDRDAIDRGVGGMP